MHLTHHNVYLSVQNDFSVTFYSLCCKKRALMPICSRSHMTEMRLLRKGNKQENVFGKTIMCLWEYSMEMIYPRMKISIQNTLNTPLQINSPSIYRQIVLRYIYKDREAWHAAVHGVTKSQTQLST